MPKEMGMSKEMGNPREMSMNGRGGHLYMQTNEVKNAIIHYHRSANGTLTEVERVATGGAGSGTYKPISGQDDAARPTPLKGRAASSCHQIAGFCLPQTAGTIRFPASLLPTREGSN